MLQDQMDTVKSTLVEVRDDVKNIKTSLEERYALKSELKSFKYVTIPLVILVTAIITGLVYYYLTHGKSIAPPVEPTSTSTTTSTPTSSVPGSTTTNTTTNTTTPGNSQNVPSHGVVDQVKKVLN